MRVQLTSIERLDNQIQGLQLAVDLMLDQDKELKDIQTMLLDQFKVDIPLSTISSYKQRRYLPEKERWEALLREKEVVLEVVKKHGTSAVSEASILEQLDEARQGGERASMQVLLREAREHEKLRLDAERLEVEKLNAETERKKLQLQVDNLQRERERLLGIVKPGVDGAAPDDAANPAEVLRRVKEVFGMA
jgi:hypothetical protein